MLASRRRASRLAAAAPTLRGSGVAYDVRKAFPYGGYEQLRLRHPRRLAMAMSMTAICVRMLEMEQSLRIIRQALDELPGGRVAGGRPQDRAAAEVRGLLEHGGADPPLQALYRGVSPPAGEVYVRTESPKGELGFYMVSDGSRKPYRMHVRGASFANLQALPQMIEGVLLADVVAAIGSIDIVLGEVDR